MTATRSSLEEAEKLCPTWRTVKRDFGRTGTVQVSAEECRPAVASALQALMDENDLLAGLLDDMKAHLDAGAETATAKDTRIVALEGEIARLRDSARVSRECFLNVLADAGEKFREEVDGDADDDGRPFVVVTYHLESRSSQFEELCEALGIKGPAFYDDTWMVAIQRAIAEPPIVLSTHPDNSTLKGEPV